MDDVLLSEIEDYRWLENVIREHPHLSEMMTQKALNILQTVRDKWTDDHTELLMSLRKKGSYFLKCQ